MRHAAGRPSFAPVGWDGAAGGSSKGRDVPLLASSERLRGTLALR